MPASQFRHCKALFACFEMIPIMLRILQLIGLSIILFSNKSQITKDWSKPSLFLNFNFKLLRIFMINKALRHLKDKENNDAFFILWFKMYWISFFLKNNMNERKVNRFSDFFQINGFLSVRFAWFMFILCYSCLLTNLQTWKRNKRDVFYWTI